MEEIPDAGGRIRAMEYGDIALLFRKTTGIGSYIDALRELNIPYLVESVRGFFETQEITDFLNLLATLAFPENRLALAGVLRSPLGGLTDKELLEWSQADGELAENSPKAEVVIRRLDNLCKDVQRLPVSEALDQILQRLPVLETATLLAGEQGRSNVLKARSMALKRENRLGAGFSGLVDWLLSRAREARDEGESPLAEENINAVRLMTVHKAKGLEFPRCGSGGVAGGRAAAQIPSRCPQGYVVRHLGAQNRFRPDAMDGSGRRPGRRPRGRRRAAAVLCRRNARSGAPGLLRRPKTPPRREAGQGGRVPRPFERGSRTGCALIAGGHNLRWQRADCPCCCAASRGRCQRRGGRRTGRHAGQVRTGLAGPGGESEEASRSSGGTPPFGSKRDATGRRRRCYIGTTPMTMPLSSAGLRTPHWNRIDFAAPQNQLEAIMDRSLAECRVDPEREEGREIRQEVQSMLEGFFASADFQEKIQPHEELGREVPCLLLHEVGEGLEQAVEGRADLVLRDGEGILVLDYKTAGVSVSEAGSKASDFTAQGALYCRAVSEVFGEEPVRFGVAFLKPGVIEILKGEDLIPRFRQNYLRSG